MPTEAFSVGSRVFLAGRDAGGRFRTAELGRTTSFNDESTMTEIVSQIAQRQADTAFRAGMTAGTLVMIGAHSIHWMITPAAHPSASDLQRLGVLAQLLVGLGGALLVTYRHQRRAAFGRSDG